MPVRISFGLLAKSTSLLCENILCSTPQPPPEHSEQHYVDLPHRPKTRRLRTLYLPVSNVFTPLLHVHQILDVRAIRRQTSNSHRLRQSTRPRKSTAKISGQHWFWNWVGQSWTGERARAWFRFDLDGIHLSGAPGARSET